MFGLLLKRPGRLSMCRNRLWQLLVALGLGGLGAAAFARDCDRVLISADPSYPPLHWYDGMSLRGASLDITTEVLRRMHLPYEIRYLGPLRRVMSAAKAGEIDMVVTLKVTPERQEFLSYPSTPAFANPIAVFVLNSHAFKYGGPADLKGRRGGIAAGNRLGGEDGRRLMESLQLEEALDAETNFRKLARGRIDYYITGLYTGLATLSQRQDAADFRVLKPYLQETFNYATFVRASPCIEHLAEFDRQLAQLVRSGAAAKLVEASLKLWRRDALETAPNEEGGP